MTPSAHPVDDELFQAWTTHATPDLSVAQVCERMDVPLAHVHAQALVDRRIHEALVAHEQVVGFAAIDQALVNLLTQLRESPKDSDRAATVLARSIRSVTAMKAALAVVLPEPAADEDENELAAKPSDPSNALTDDDRATIAPARYRDELDRPIDMAHPDIVNAAMIAAYETRRKLETDARDRQLRLLPPDFEAASPSLPRSGSTNFELYCPDDSPSSSSLLPPLIDLPTFAHGFELFLLQRPHEAPATPAPRKRGRSPRRPSPPPE
jgi:hypothetical protein